MNSLEQRDDIYQQHVRRIILHEPSVPQGFGHQLANFKLAITPSVYIFIHTFIMTYFQQVRKQSWRRTAKHIS